MLFEGVSGSVACSKLESVEIFFGWGDIQVHVSLVQVDDLTNGIYISLSRHGSNSAQTGSGRQSLHRRLVNEKLQSNATDPVIGRDNRDTESKHLGFLINENKLDLKITQKNIPNNLSFLIKYERGLIVIFHTHQK